MLWLGYSLVGVVLISFVVAATGNAVVMAVNKLAGLERPIAPPASLVVDEALVESLGKHVWTEHARPLLQSARETLRLESWERDARVIAAVYVAAGAASLLSAGTMATLWCAATAACMADHRFAAQVRPRPIAPRGRPCAPAPFPLAAPTPATSQPPWSAPPPASSRLGHPVPSRRPLPPPRRSSTLRPPRSSPLPSPA